MKKFLSTICLILLVSLHQCNLRFKRIYDPKPIGSIGSQIENKNITRTKLQFIVIGDWGEKGNFYQKDVASAIEKIMRERKIDFILTTGDNFYPNGVENISDSHFKKSFEEIYSFAQETPWYISLGNHDYYGNIQALIDYQKSNKNWILPSTYYSLIANVADTDALFLITDTNEFIKIAGFPYRTYIDSNLNQIQIKWMNDTLSQSLYGWKIVAGHHPIFSGGDHGDTEVLKKDFLDIMESNQVDIYFSGHDHDLQYLRHPDYRTHFFISGAGSKVRKLKNNPNTVFAKSEAGFILTTLENKTATIEFVNSSGIEIYKTKIEK